MQPDDKMSGTKSDLLVKKHSVVSGIKKEVEDKHSRTNEPNRKANMVEDTDKNIDVMNHGDEVESMKPNMKESDTESDLLKAHPNVIGIKEEDEDEHSGKKETDRESNFAGDTDANIGDMIIGEIVEGMQHDIKGSDTKANLLEEAHSIVIDTIEEVEDKHSGAEEPNQKSELEIITSWGMNPSPYLQQYAPTLLGM